MVFRTGPTRNLARMNHAASVGKITHRESDPAGPREWRQSPLPPQDETRSLTGILCGDPVRGRSYRERKLRGEV